MNQRYAETVRRLQELEVARGWDLGLARIERALALRGHPERTFATIHVGGTNGKGTVAAVMESVLRTAGYRTGLYTSPHLVDFAERIRAAGRMMPQAAVVDMVPELGETFEREGLALTHFEFVTALAFEWFARIGVEIAVIEVGLGGRLDATNVLEPEVTVLTSIALDHQEFLGENLASIATEKAGIMRPGVPLCLGRQAPEAEQVLLGHAATLGAPVLRAGVDGMLVPGTQGRTFEGPGVRWDELRTAWDAPWQQEAQILALLALAAITGRWPLDEEAVRRGVAEAEWPGRLAVLPGVPEVVLDGAHNHAGMLALARELPRLLRGRPARLVFSSSCDKPWRDMLPLLVPFVRDAVVTEAGRRPTPAESIAFALGEHGIPVHVVREPVTAVEAACEGLVPDTPVLVTGSLFVVGAAYAALIGPLFESWQGWEADGRQRPP